MGIIKTRQVEFSQGSAEWLQWRETGQGGSDVPIIMGQGRKFKKSRFCLWLEKTGQRKPLDISNLPHVRRGVRLEPVVREILARHFGTNITPILVEDASNPHRKVSLDGIMVQYVNGDAVDIPVEIKCPGAKGFADVVTNTTMSEDYIYYNLQVQYQIALTNAPFAYLAFYNECGDKPRLKLFKVLRDQDLIDSILTEVDEFQSLVDNLLAPKLDPELDVIKIDTELSAQWKADSLRLYELRQEEAELKAKLDAIKSELVEINGRFDTATYGHKKFQAGNVVVTRSQRITTDYKSLIANEVPNLDEATIAKYRKSGTSSVSVKIVDKKQAESDADQDLLSILYGNNLVTLSPSQVN
ncbi:lambda-exonuclease family protein [Vibrio agarivorans]|uniref:YqaJ viral recombinase family protein n=1 Tax=Vibrio agarivorans TaxID=153622 RepID=A0ABT7Y7C9_9VIBR|nr:YqaJ viral recombinase family protein [Vibrio agarivorans]MDN2483951.1 YqaJ viral recombinase family protein [Vibrio agarivorans]